MGCELELPTCPRSRSTETCNVAEEEGKRGEMRVGGYRYVCLYVSKCVNMSYAPSRTLALSLTYVHYTNLFFFVCFLFFLAWGG